MRVRSESNTLRSGVKRFSQSPRPYKTFICAPITVRVGHPAYMTLATGLRLADFAGAADYMSCLDARELRRVIARSGDPRRAKEEIAEAVTDARRVAGVIRFVAEGPLSRLAADAAATRGGDGRGPGRWLPGPPWPAGSEMAAFRAVFEYWTQLDPMTVDQLGDTMSALSAESALSAVSARSAALDRVRRIETVLVGLEAVTRDRVGRRRSRTSFWRR